MLFRSGRKYIEENGQKVTAEVVGFSPIDSDSAFIRIRTEEGFFDDAYNVLTLDCMKALSHAHSNEKVMVTIVPDSSGDNDFHPEVQDAWLEGLKEGYGWREEDKPELHRLSSEDKRAAIVSQGRNPDEVLEQESELPPAA